MSDAVLSTGIGIGILVGGVALMLLIFLLARVLMVVGFVGMLVGVIALIGTLAMYGNSPSWVPILITASCFTALAGALAIDEGDE